MKKKQFLSKLKKELSIFNEDKQEELYYKYKDMLNRNIKNKEDEEKEVEKLGSISKIIDTELENMKTSKRKTKSKSKSKELDKKIGDYFKETAKDFINSLGKVLNVNTDEELIKIMTQITISLVLVLLLKVPFYVIKEIGVNIFNLFPNILSYLFSIIWSFLVQIAYLITSIVLIYFIVKKVILKEDIKKIDLETKKDLDSYKRLNEFDFFETVLFIISIPLYVVEFILIILLGVVIGFVFKGVFSIGILVIVISLLIIFTSIISLVNKMIFKGKRL